VEILKKITISVEHICAVHTGCFNISLYQAIRFCEELN